MIGVIETNIFLKILSSFIIMVSICVLYFLKTAPSLWLCSPKEAVLRYSAQVRT